MAEDLTGWRLAVPLLNGPTTGSVDETDLFVAQSVLDPDLISSVKPSVVVIRIISPNKKKSNRPALRIYYIFILLLGLKKHIYILNPLIILLLYLKKKKYLPPSL